jgi:hypothetical protein
VWACGRSATPLKRVTYKTASEMGGKFPRM